METYDNLIIGGGMTSDSAVKGIRELDSHGKIGVLSSEPDPPYDRPPLSKDLWKGTIELGDIWRKNIEKDVDLHLKCTVKRIDPVGKLVYDDKDNSYHYEKLLLATGGKPHRLPGDVPEVINYRTVEDYRRLRRLADEHSEFCVIGGGFIGSEIAAALTMVHRNVTMIFPGSGLCRHVLPEELSQFVTSYYREKGVKILSNESVTSIGKAGDNIFISTRGGHDLSSEVVVTGLGISPNTELAVNAGLTVQEGIVVDKYLRTSNPEIYAAGDVANFQSSYLDKRMRVEHEDNANKMGVRAGRNMAGENIAYTHQPMFYSDLFELGYEAVGDLDSRLETIVDWTEEFRKGVIYYLDKGRIRGILLWNILKQVDNARKLILEKKQYKPDELIGLLH
jgi:3-phenylpropionate/trans-cinnamate dioxygenase ferredoxin reductase component